MTDRLRWGILATGRIAADFTRDLQLVGATVAAVGSRDPAKAEQFAARFGIPRSHGGYEDLVSDPDVDVVYVATPNHLHGTNALLALEAGKHVLVEKPFALNVGEARIVVDRARELGLVVLEAMWTRWMPHMIRIRELARSGALGDLRGLIADHSLKLPDDPAHRVRAPELGGGALLDLGIYPVSFAWDLFGAPDRVMAMSTRAPTGVDAGTSILLGYPRAQATLHTMLDARGPITATVIGTEARIEIDSFWYFPNSFTVYDSAGRVTERFEQEVPGRGMQFQAVEMERLVAAGLVSGDILPPEQSVAIMGTLDTIRRQIGLRFPAEPALEEGAFPR
jgi:predicted dehydrogenase